MICRNIIVFVSLFLVSGGVSSESDIHLSTRLAPLSDTPSAQLGTNEAAIGLKPGSAVSPFTIKTHEGNEVSLASLLSDAPLMVVFYRGGWCSYCNLQVKRLTDAWPEFKRRNIMPIVISVDAVNPASLAQRTYDIPFLVLSDPDLKAHKAFKVGFKLDDATLKKYIAHGINLKQWSQRSHNTIAFPSVFILNKEGVVKWAHTTSDYTTRPSIEQLLSVIDALKLNKL